MLIVDDFLARRMYVTRNGQMGYRGLIRDLYVNKRGIKDYSEELPDLKC